MQKPTPNLNIIIKASLEAGKIIRRDFKEIENLQSSLNGADKFAQRSARKANDRIINTLQTARPRYNILSKETGKTEAEDVSHTFVIDPINGKTNFTHGIPFFCISIALLEQKEVIAACIYNPISDELYYADKGEGAVIKTSHAERRLRVSKRKDKNSIISCYLPKEIKENDNIFNIINNIGTIRTTGSKALDLAYLSAGKFDACILYDNKIYETIAGVFLTRESGGLISSLDKKDAKTTGELAISKEIIATNGALNVSIHK